MIIKLETLLENGIIDPNKITELVCDGKTVYKGYSDDIASFGKDYEFIKFNNTVNESFNTPTYTIEVKAKNPVNESFTSQFGLNTKADVIKSMKYFDYYDEDKKDALLEELDYLIDRYSINEASAAQIKSNTPIANKIKQYLQKYGVKFTWRINKHVDAIEKAFRGDVNDIKLALVAMPINLVSTPYGGYAANYEGTRIIIFTDKSIEVYGKGIITGKKVRKYQLEAINDVVVNEGMVWAKVTVNFKQTGNAYESHMCLGRINKNATTAIQEFLSSYKPNIGFTREFDKDNKKLNESTEVLSENKQQVLKDISKNGKSNYKTSQKVKDEKSGVMVSIHQVPDKSYEDNNSKFHKKVQGIVNGMEKRNGKDFDENERTAVYNRVTKEVKDDYERQAYNKEEQEAKKLNGFKNRANYQKKQLKKLNK